MTTTLDQPTVLLFGFRPIPLDLYEALLEDFRSGCSRLGADCRVCTARQISPEGLWDTLSLKEKRLVGLCLSHMVNEGLLPLEKIKAKGYPRRYQLTSHQPDQQVVIASRHKPY